ncbi:MAG TPA: hypothetical protein VG778_02995 [Blastocatellia bacterium]|nr:hypothetical protein [Blastocatellia bacterium]
MKQPTIDDEMFARYLLGKLSEEELDQIDERHFGDREFIEQLLVVEDDLIDSYVRGDLSPTDRRQFETHFMRSPERQRRVILARSLMHVVSNPRKVEQVARTSGRETKRRSQSWVVIPLAASLVLVATSLWLVLQISRLNAQLDQARAALSAAEMKAQEIEDELAEERKASDRLREDLARTAVPQPEPEPSTAPMVAFVLKPGLQRTEGEATRFVVPPEAKQVQLQVNFNVGDYPNYTATLETVEGRRVWTQTGLKARRTNEGKVITLNIPAPTLSDQDYVLMLGGVSRDAETASVGEYSFRIVRR